MVTPDSIDLSRKQQLYFDAAEESFKYIRLTYSRLLSTLINYVSEPTNEKRDALILDCWVLVDLIRRLCTVLEKTPGLRHNGVLSQFLETIRVVTNFRHHIQHMEAKATKMAPTGYPIWGSVSWAQTLDGKHFEVLMYMPGRLAQCKGIPMVNPAGRLFYAPVDHIELTISYDETVNLSELVRSVERFEASYNAIVKEAESRNERDTRGLLRIELSLATPPNDQQQKCIVSAPSTVKVSRLESGNMDVQLSKESERG